MRCFIAIDIDEEIIKKIGGLQDELRRKTNLKGRQVKWVESSNIHLTLKFLGEVRDASISGVCGLVDEAAEGHKGFDIEIGRLGVFGRPARVLWVGTGESASLLNIQEDIEQRFRGAGWGGDNRKFSGHLTLCRIKSAGAGRKLERLVDDYRDFQCGVSAVDSICVYKSDLTSAGPVYTLISRSLLK
jgi:2'-5' RNA ligase